jgi:hypothetical protein
LLHTFGEISGLKTNLIESGYIPIAIPQDISVIIEPLMQCPQLSLPTTYLGLPLTIKKPPKEVYLPLTSCVQHRYDGWTGKQLSPAGRLIRPKRYAPTLHVGFPVAWVTKIITQITRRFLWKGTADKFSGGNCLVPWKQVTLPKRFGGLGITDLQLQNWALLTKWIWLASSNEPSLWTTTLQSLNHTIPIDLKNILTGHSTFFLKDLLKLQPIMQAATTRNIHNQLTWALNHNQGFTVKSTYIFLNNPGIPNPTLHKI